MTFIDRFTLCFLCCLLYFQVGFTQKSNVSGIINQYASVNTILKEECGDTIIVDNPINAIRDEKLLIIQMKGASINSTNTTNFGQIQLLNEAGNFEVISVDTIINNKIITHQSLQSSYDVDAKVQVVKIPTYRNVLVSGELKSIPWNGSIGGILAIDVIDTLELNNNIKVDGDGFKGGVVVMNTYAFSNSACSITDYFNPKGDRNGGEKGEGITERKTAYQCGRGSLANGGGGGNSHNSGGAGGGNYGAGGSGGREWDNCGSTNVGGISGNSILYTSLKNKIFLGGGGGAGEANGSQGSSGGNGGGLIFITANNLKSNGFKISAKGDSAITAAADGAGGGGAGGTVLLDVNKYLDTARVDVVGGEGGKNNNSGSCVGTGGGGGGGAIWYQGTMLPTLLKYSIAGGQSGKFINNNQSSCYNTSFGSSAGNIGGILNNLDINIIDNDTIARDLLGSDTIMCPSQSLVLDVTTLNATYLWQDNSTSPIFVVTQKGIYWVEVSDNCHVYIDTISVSYEQSINLNLGTDTTLCPNEVLTLDATTPNATYRWQDNSINSTYLVTQTGIYWVEVSLNDCSYIDSILVTIESIIPDSLLISDTSICLGNTISLDVTNPNSNYLWNDGTTLPIKNINHSGIYWVDVIDKCSFSSDTIIVQELNCNCFLILPNVFTPNNDRVNDILKPRSVNYSKFSNCNYKNYNFSIFNRWGEKIFESNDIEIGWDGRHGGKMVNSGVFAYTIHYRLNGESKKTSGSFLVLN